MAIAQQAHHPAALAADWHVATHGVPNASGAEAAPWQMGSALDDRHNIEAGDTIWIHEGRYKAEPKVDDMGFEVKLAGRDGAPIQVAALF